MMKENEFSRNFSDKPMEELTNSLVKNKSPAGKNNRKVLVDWKIYVLVTCFASSSWIDINGLWVELPYFVQYLPESWNLSSFLVIIIQIANVGPLIYTLLEKIFSKRIKEWPVIYLIIIVGMVSTVMLHSFWNKTAIINGKERSLYLFIFASLLALVDCTSSVVYLPYMANFHPQYMSALYFGEGLSGFLPSMVGLIQGTGIEPTCVNKTLNSTNSSGWIMMPKYSQPNFSVSAFMLFLFGVLIISCVAFSILHFYYRKRMKSSNENEAEPFEKTNSLNSSSKTNKNENGKVILLLVVTYVSNAFTNGVIPSIQTYSCLPYGNQAYNLSLRLGMLANPLVCFVSLFKCIRNSFYIVLITLIGCFCCIYQLIIASYSPTVPLKDDWLGKCLVIMTSIILFACLSYVKVCCATLLMSNGRKCLLWCGIVNQGGSLVGALCCFLLINVFRVFRTGNPC